MNRVPVLAGLALLSTGAVLVGVSGGSSPAAFAARPVAFSIRALAPGATTSVALPATGEFKFAVTPARASAVAIFVPGRAIPMIRTTKSKLVATAFRTIRVADSSILAGRSVVVQTGRTGLVRYVYQRTAKGARLISNKLVRRVVVAKVRNLIIHVGTRHVYRYHSPSHFPAVPAAVAALNWHALAMCEAGGRIYAVTSGLYFGEYQFLVSTWASVGGRGLPTDGSGAEQTYRAELLFERSGGSPWPYCSRYL